MAQRAKLAVIREYFGLRPDDGLKEFSAELKELDADEKLELAQGAAKELGLTQADVAFDLGS